MKILVIGAGAVGSVLAARLVGAGETVTLVARAEHAAAIRANGLRVEGDRPGTFRPEAFSEVPSGSSYDMALLTVKTFDLEAAARAIPRTGVLPLPLLLPQNGLHIEALVVPRLRDSGWADPERWVVRAVNSIPVTWVGPGVVRQAGRGELLLRDPRIPHPASDATRKILDLLRGDGISARAVSDLEREVWRKALVNAAINPVTAVHRIRNGRLSQSPYREDARSLLREAQTTAASEGFDFPDAEADADLARVVAATAENRSSMLQDVERGRPTEIDAISGELVRIAAGHGIDLPATRAAIARVRAAVGSRPA